MAGEIYLADQPRTKAGLPSHGRKHWLEIGMLPIQDFPNVTLYDNVTLQHRLVTEKVRHRQGQLAVGWSMGAQQSYQWGALYPDMVERIAPFCGSARTACFSMASRLR